MSKFLASQELALQVHRIERVGDFIVVGFDLAWRFTYVRFVLPMLKQIYENLTLPAKVQFEGKVRMATATGMYILSGTSSRPLSAMIAVDFG